MVVREERTFELISTSSFAITVPFMETKLSAMPVFTAIVTPSLPLAVAFEVAEVITSSLVSAVIVASLPASILTFSPIIMLETASFMLMP